MPTNKELWEQGIRSKHPDQTFENEDDLYGASMAGYDAEHEYHKKAAADNEQLMSIIDEYPDLAMFMSTLISGESPAKAFSYLDRTLSDLRNGDDEFNAHYVEEVGKRKKERDDKAAQDAAFLENSSGSEQALQEFMDEKGMDEQQLEEFMGKFQEILSDLSNGRLNKEILDMVYNHVNRDIDLADAHDAGVIEGRNQKIDAKKAREQNTDGLPSVVAGGEAPVAPPQRRKSMIEQIAADSVERNKIYG